MAEVLHFWFDLPLINTKSNFIIPTDNTIKVNDFYKPMKSNLNNNKKKAKINYIIKFGKK